MAIEIPTIKKEFFQNGQLLKVEDFTTEQEFHIRHREFQTQQLFSPGVLTGLTVTNDGTTLKISPGAAFDENGTQILLGTKATFESKPLDRTSDSFDIDMSGTAYQNKTWLLTIKHNMVAVPVAEGEIQNQQESSPLIELSAKLKSKAGKVLLASIEAAAESITVTNKSTPIQLLSSRIPPQVVSDFDASAMTSGVLDAARIPNIQKLKGQLTPAQLPGDIGGVKEYVTFFVDQPVIDNGTEIKLTWKSDNGVDGLALAYLTTSGIQNLTTADGAIQLSEIDHIVLPTQTTTFTLTAQINGKTVAQKQLTITVHSVAGSIKDYAISLKANDVALDDAVAAMATKFNLAAFSSENAEKIVIPIVDAGYDYMYSISQVAKHYSQDENWALMIQLAGKVSLASTPSEIVTWIQGLAAPVPDYLANQNYDFTVYCDQVLTSISTPVGNKYVVDNLSAYAIYMFANGIYTAKPNYKNDSSWGKVVSTVILKYYTTIKKIDPGRLPSNFPKIVTAATTD